MKANCSMSPLAGQFDGGTGHHLSKFVASPVGSAPPQQARQGPAEVMDECAIRLAYLTHQGSRTGFRRWGGWMQNQSPQAYATYAPPLAIDGRRGCAS